MTIKNKSVHKRDIDSIEIDQRFFEIFLETRNFQRREFIIEKELRFDDKALSNENNNRHVREIENKLVEKKSRSAQNNESIRKINDIKRDSKMRIDVVSKRKNTIINDEI